MSGGWQDISTAPKDGTGVQLIDMTAANPAPGFGNFVHGSWSAVPADAESSGMPRALFLAMVWDTPTHWMPLPDPPVSP